MHLLIKNCVQDGVPTTKPKGRCLASGLYIHINQEQLIVNNPVINIGDYYWDVDFGLYTWNGKEFI